MRRVATRSIGEAPMLRPLKQACGCLILLAVLTLIAGITLILLSFAFFDRSHAQSPPTFDIVLVIDQSGSMWDCGNRGTDPDFLRVDAAQLFIQYLGADAGSSRYRVALLHFGGTVRIMAPFTELSDDSARTALINATSNPEPIGWTNPLTALATAQDLLSTSALPGSRRVVLLMTDGEPAWPADQRVDRTAYRQQLQQLAEQFAAEETDLFFVHLRATDTPCGQRAITDWLDLWQQMSDLTPYGALYTATQADDLVPIYHAVVRNLTGASDSQTLVQAADLPTDQPLQVSVPVTEPLASMTLVTVKGDPATAVVVQDPNGQLIAPTSSGVSVVGIQTKQEIWRIEQPTQGLWQVLLTGSGKVTVWQDRVLAPPTPTALPTPTPTATATETATATATETMTATPTPTLTPLPSATPTATTTDTPTATATETATATPTSTDTPTATPTLTATPIPTVTQPPPPRQGSTRYWFIALAVTGALGIVWVTQTNRGPYLQGVLVPVQTPLSASSEEFIPFDLASLRQKRFHLGVRGKGPWRLIGWAGRAMLSVDEQGRTTLAPFTRVASITDLPDAPLQLNDQPVYGRTPLQDGDLLRCGEYLFRYENLLQ